MCHEACVNLPQGDFSEDRRGKKGKKILLKLHWIPISRNVGQSGSGRKIPPKEHFMMQLLYEVLSFTYGRKVCRSVYLGFYFFFIYFCGQFGYFDGMR